jgi:hypothetical protein
MLQVVRSDALPPSLEVAQTFGSNTSLLPDELLQKSVSLLFPGKWSKSNPNYINCSQFPHECVSLEEMEWQTVKFL